MPPLPSTLELHVLDVNVGLWCDACALPSAVEVRWSLADTVTLATHFTGGHVNCESCQACWIVK